MFTVKQSVWVLALCVLMVGGCATYVNIPPQPGDVALHDPNSSTVREVVLEGLRACIEEHAMHGRFRVVLPAGATPTFYDQIVTNLSPNATWADLEQGAAAKGASGAGVPALVVKQVRIRGAAAQVDIARPLFTGGVHNAAQLVTVVMSWDLLTGWGTDRVRVWQGEEEPMHVGIHVDVDADANVDVQPDHSAM